jgi:hypothetical protein
VVAATENNPAMDYIRQFKEWQHYFDDADFIDIKTIESRNDLRTFIAAMLSYFPWWILMLYRIRVLVVHALGLIKHAAPEELPNLQPEQIPFVRGEMATFFIVRMAEEDV